jgi:protein-S-isoprenylcysteine O-methyltransferase Ste14
MNLPVLVLLLGNLLLIGALPRIFFRRGTLNLHWWLTASPFFVAGALLLAGAGGVVSPVLPPSAVRESLAVVLCAASVALIAFTLGTHQEPLSLWHQENDAPRRLVTHGAYARVRHPFYAAFLLALLGCTAALPHPGMAVLFLFACVKLSRTAAREERRLLASAFGAEYREYLRRTGRFLPSLPTPHLGGRMDRSPLIAAALFSLLASGAAAQAPTDTAPARRAWEWAGVPALNYDADEGFGYGAILELYRYGHGAHPYRYTIQPTVFLTTGGRRDYTVFFDAPDLLPGEWRVDAFAGSEEQIASPYYGAGNEAQVEKAADDGPNPYYYRFGRTRRQASANLQHPLGATPLRVLVGAGAAHVSINPVPRDSGTTLLAGELAGGEAPDGWSNYLRGGVVWDTRDRETGTRRGTWSELLVQRVDEALGSESSFTRWTLTDRRYLPLGSRLTLANRVMLQGVEGDAPFYELYTVQTSFKQQEGLGGAKTLRGVPKNRFVGKGMFLWNAELRWRAADFRAMGKPAHVVLSGFVDSGRVWEERVQPGEVFSGLHHGVGGGVRLGMGENFVVALDVGHGAETGAPFYIGLGYLY